MELSIQKTSLPYLRQVLHKIHYQEETGEAIVPDSYPDMAAIIDAYAEAVIRNKDCRSDSVVLSGGIRGAVLYQPEDGTAPKCLDFYLPFTVKFEHNDLVQDSPVLCRRQIWRDRRKT